MNEKKLFIFIVCILLLFPSCRTANGIHDNRSGAYEVREHIEKLGGEQTQSAVTSTELKTEIDRSLELVGEVDKFIKNGAGDLEEFKAILQRIRERGKRGDTGKTKSD